MQETQEQTIDLRGIINIIRKRLGLIFLVLCQIVWENSFPL